MVKLQTSSLIQQNQYIYFTRMKNLQSKLSEETRIKLEKLVYIGVKIQINTNKFIFKAE